MEGWKERKKRKEVERAARPFIRMEGMEEKEEWKDGRKGSRAGGSPVQETGRKGREDGRMEGNEEIGFSRFTACPDLSGFHVSRFTHHAIK